MGSQIIDSDRRCPRCSKRMMLEIGQADSDAVDRFSNRAELVHQCWSCGYSELDRNWKRPTVGSAAAAERLARLRLEGPTPYPWEVASADAS